MSIARRLASQSGLIFLTRLFGANGSGLPHRWLADVSLWICEKDPATIPRRCSAAAAARLNDLHASPAIPS